MKPFLFFIFLVFLTLPMFAQNKLSEIDLRVNGVGSGTSYSTVVRKLGKPKRSKTIKLKVSETCSNSAETDLTLFYSGLEVALVGDGRGRNLGVYSIKLTSGKWLASGVSIGADAKDVTTKFGEPYSKAEKSDETILYYVMKGTPGGVNLHFRDNKLVKVAMTETLC